MFLTLIILVLIIIIATDNVEKVLSKKGTYYSVYTDFPDSTTALMHLARLDDLIMLIMTDLKNKYPTDPVVMNMLTRYNPDGIGEVRPNNLFGRTAFTVSKGRLTKFCLRDKNGQLHSFQDLVFVAYHELAHMGDWNSGHSPTFWAVFKFILMEAESAGIYTSTNYFIKPITYCGIFVQYNPRYDPNLAPYYPKN